MIVTDQDLDAFYGTDRPRASVTSVVDEVREELRQEYGSDHQDGPIENDPAKISLMDVDDFYDDVSVGFAQHRVDRPDAPNVEVSPVLRPGGARQVSTGLVWAFMALLGISLLGAFLWFNEDAKAALNDSLRSVISLVTPAPAIGEGLVHQNVQARRDVRNGEDYLIVEGQVANAAEQTLAVPLLKIALTDVGGKEIIARTQRLSIAYLAPGETTPFTVEFKNPPGNARSMQIKFSLPTTSADGPLR